MARWPGGYDPVNGDQEPSNIQSGGWPDQNREQAGLRDSGNLRYWSSFRSRIYWLKPKRPNVKLDPGTDDILMLDELINWAL